MERVIQLEIFSDAPEIEEIDPRDAIGPDTRVSALYRVRYPEAKQWNTTSYSGMKAWR